VGKGSEIYKAGAVKTALRGRVFQISVSDGAAMVSEEGRGDAGGKERFIDSKALL
jgi:hypothetical protein